MQAEDYKYLTCPAANCPNDNNVKIIKHDEFDQQRVDEIKWSFDATGYSFNCKVIVRANSGMNGKLNVELSSVGHQSVHVFWLPNKFDNMYNEDGGPWGILETGRIYYHRKDNDRDSVPTDWHIIIFYYIDRKIFWGTKSLIIKSWVSHFDKSDVARIRDWW